MPSINTVYSSHYQLSDVAGPHQLHAYASPQQLKLQQSSNYAPNTAEILTPHRAGNHAVPSRRGSQDAVQLKLQRRGSAHASVPYDVVHSPTRARFGQQDANATIPRSATAYPPPLTSKTAPCQSPAPSVTQQRNLYPDSLSRRSTGAGANGTPGNYQHPTDRSCSLVKSLSVLSVSSSSTSASSPSYHSHSPSASSTHSRESEMSPRTQRSSSGTSSHSAESESKSYKRPHTIPLDRPGVHGPMNHMRVPQGCLDWSFVAGDRDVVHPSIEFYVEGMPEPGVRVSDVLTSKTRPLRNGNERVLNFLIEKSIYFWVAWPGYAPAKKRVSVHHGAITRNELATALCKAFEDWVKDMISAGPQNPEVAPAWVLAKKKVDMSRIFITSLIHWNKANWQLELWVPDYAM